MADSSWMWAIASLGLGGTSMYLLLAGLTMLALSFLMALIFFEMVRTTKE